MSKLRMNNGDIWNDVYRAEITPWDIGKPDINIKNLIDTAQISPCRTLDVGCGAGNEAIFLQKHGFDVVGIDISSEAVNRARERSVRNKTNCSFIVGDILRPPPALGKFGFVLDKACFHFVRPELRQIYVQNIGKILKPSGKYLLFAASQCDSDIGGPYKFRDTDIVSIFEPTLKLQEIRLVKLENHALKPMPYMALFEQSSAE